MFRYLLVIFCFAIVLQSNAFDCRLMRQKLDSAYNENHDVYDLLDSLKSLAGSYEKSNPSAAFKCYNMALEFCTARSLHSYVADLQSEIGNLYWSQGLLDNAYEYLQRAHEYYLFKGSVKALAWNYIDIGNVHFARNDFQKASEYYHSAAEYFKLDGDFYGLATASNNIALGFLQESMPDSAIAYFNNALIIRQEIGEMKHVALSFEYLARGYFQLGDIDRCMVFYDKAYNIYDSLNLSGSIAGVYLGQAQLLIYANHPDSAINLVNEAYKLFEKDSNLVGQIACLEIQSTMLYSIGSFKRAIATCNRAIELSDSISSQIQKLQLLQILYQSYDAVEDFKNAFMAYKSFRDLQDTLDVSQLEESIQQKEFAILSSHMEQELQKIQREREVQELVDDNRMNLIYYFLLTIVILFLMAISNLGFFKNRVALLNEFSFYSTFKVKFLILLLTGLYYFFLAIWFVPVTENDYTSLIFSAFIAGLIAVVILIVNFYAVSFIGSGDSEKSAFLKFVTFITGVLVCEIVAAWYVGKAVHPDYYSNISFFYLLIVVCTSVFTPLIFLFLIIEKMFVIKHERTAKVLSYHLNRMVPAEEDSLICIQSDKTKDKLELLKSELYYIEAKGNYSEIVYKNKGNFSKKLILISLKEIESQLEDIKDIKRCHKSFMVSIPRVSKVAGNSQGYRFVLEEEEFSVPVSRRFPKDLITKIQEEA